MYISKCNWNALSSNFNQKIIYPHRRKEIKMTENRKNYKMQMTWKKEFLES